MSPLYLDDVRGEAACTDRSATGAGSDVAMSDGGKSGDPVVTRVGTYPVPQSNFSLVRRFPNKQRPLVCVCML